jgi:hypothetical protein
MSITRMCQADASGAQGPFLCDAHRPEGPTYFTRTTHHGLVLSLEERNGYHDSDFYAIVWNPETRSPETIEYATTRGWTYPAGANVDASDEIREEYRAWADQRAEERREARAKREAADPTPGKRVRVVAGRGPHGFEGTWQGTEAVIFWRGAYKFATYYRNRPDDPHNQRIGLRLEDGRRVYTALTNVEVIP